MDNEPEFLRIRNWERYQEYKDGRAMRFFRVDTSILDDPAFGDLANEAEPFWLMALAARTGNKIPNDPKYLRRMVPTDRPINVERMIEVGFLEGFLDEEKDFVGQEKAVHVPPNGSTKPSVDSRRSSHENPLEEKRREEKRKEDKVVVEIYDHWRQQRNKSHGRFDRISDNRRTKIVARLREFSADELIRAIDAVALDPWEDRPRHDDLIVLFRNEEQVQKFLALADDDSVLDPSERQRRHLERLRSEGKVE